MEIQELMEIKARCLSEMAEALPKYEERLAAIDPRVLDYARDVCRTDIDIHNLDELLCLRRFLRYLDTYDMDVETCQQMIVDAEGTWDGLHYTGRKDRRGRVIEDGLKIDGIYGYRHYRLTMSQVYIICYLFGFKRWVDTKSPNGCREMLATERAGEGGTIEDHRRLITSFVMMLPRKYAKTFLGAFVQFEGMIRGPRDYEGYIAANNQTQSLILFKQLRNMLEQKDPQHNRFRFTQTEINWTYETGRTGSVTAMTAGGKTKDGLKACCCSADEFGAAQRVKDHCDMEGLINVIEGSMGPAREPLTVHTSTAGLGLETPYEILTRNFHESLLKEMDIPIGEARETSGDWQAGIILRPDAWETEDAVLRTERVIKKCNPHLGITIQADFYEQEWKKADAQGELKRKEVITKLYNIFQSGRSVEWIKPERIRQLQVPMTIADCTYENGWMVSVGMDFSLGRDLHSLTFLACRRRQNIQDGEFDTEFFADMAAWITEETLQNSTIGSLLQDWVDKGMLYVSPGSTLQPTLPVDLIMSLYDRGIQFFGFGYDANKAKMPINALAQWMVDKTGDINMPKQMLMPIGQTYYHYTSPVNEIDFLVKAEPALLHFSMNPMWPYEFGCVNLDMDPRIENVKPIKNNPGSDACLVDNVQSLCNAFSVYDIMEGKQQG